MRSLIVGVVLSLLLCSSPIRAQDAPTVPGARPADSTQTGDHPTTLTPVEVVGTPDQGYHEPDALAVGPFGEMKLQDTPYALTVTSSKLIQNLGAHSLTDALRTNPTVYSAQSTFTDARGVSDMLIRGFVPNYLRDGLYINAYNMPSVEGVERLEVMNGLSGFLYGFMSPGGTVNFVTKEPVRTFHTSARVGTYGGGQAYGDVDIAGPIDRASRLTYRVNVFATRGNTYIDQQRYNSTLLSGKLNYHVSPGTVVKVHYYHNEFTQHGAQVQFAFDPEAVSLPAPVDATRLYGQPWTMNGIRSDQFGAGLESRVSTVFSVRVNWNHSYMDWERHTLRSTVLNDLGDYRQQYRFYGPQLYTTDTGYGLMDAKFTTGPLTHTLTFGYWGQNERDLDAASASEDLGVFNMASPSYVPESPLTVTDRSPIFRSAWYYNSIVLGDRIAYGDHWAAIVGVNQAWDHESYRDLTTGTLQSHPTSSALSPSVSLIYKPAPQVSTYASYMQGLQGGLVAPTDAANANQLLPPGISAQYEIGLKATAGRLFLTTALFRINQINTETDPADNYYKQVGREIHQGVEFTATGRVTQSLSVVGGVTLLNARVRKAVADTLSEGKIPLDVPEQQASAYLEYVMPFAHALTVSAGTRYFGRRPVDPHNLAFVPGVATFDAGLRYAFHRVTLTVNATNLLDKEYWASYTAKSDSRGLQFGAPRTITASISATW